MQDLPNLEPSPVGRRVSVITGASSGVGAACSELLRSRGWDVVGLDLSPPATHSAGVHHLRCDVTDETMVKDAFAEIARMHGRVDALVCSAAISDLGPIATIPLAKFDAMMRVNLRGSLLPAQTVIPIMSTHAGVDNPCDIIFLSSIAALRPKVGNGIYGATKAAINHLTRVLAGELGPSHIRVNAVAPSWMDTPMTQRLLPTGGYRRSAEPPLGRQATPNDVALMVGLMLSPDWTFTTGVVIPVDGGSSRVYIPS